MYLLRYIPRTKKKPKCSTFSMGSSTKPINPYSKKAYFILALSLDIKFCKNILLNQRTRKLLCFGILSEEI